MENVRSRVGGVNVRGVEIAGYGCEQVNVALGYRVRQAGGVADSHLLECSIFDEQIRGFIIQAFCPSTT